MAPDILRWVLRWPSGVLVTPDGESLDFASDSGQLHFRSVGDRLDFASDGGALHFKSEEGD